MVTAMATVEHGFLLLADLTGYTAYLARELAHAPVIAGDPLETIVGRLEPPFRLAKFEGDAALLFAEDDRTDPSLRLDSIEASYFAFRRRLRSIESATSCDCQACSLAPRLDLKYIVHHGPYLRSSIAGRDELAGPEVIVAHRLLKGTAAADARGHGFAVFTSAATHGRGGGWQRRRDLCLLLGCHGRVPDHPATFPRSRRLTLVRPFVDRQRPGSSSRA